MLCLLCVTALALPADLAARNAERDQQLKPLLAAMAFDAAKANAAEELVKAAQPLACEPIRDVVPVRCAQQLPTGDPELCWHGAIVATIYQRQLQMETGDTESSDLLFTCGSEVVSGRLTSQRRRNGQLATTVSLTRLSDKRSLSAELAWQPVTLPADSPVPWERRLDRLRRPVELARAEFLADLQRGKGDIIDVTAAACAKARQALRAEKPFAGDDTWLRGVLAWLDAVEADHTAGPTSELARRAALSVSEREKLERSLAGATVTSTTPLSALPMQALMERFQRTNRERDAALQEALRRFRQAHPFKPAP